MTKILRLASEFGLKVIEDCAQAHGALFKGQKLGTLGDVGTFSFYPRKNLGAYGDAGAIVTNNEALARRCRMISNHGRVDKYDHLFEGRNSRLDGRQAAILRVKLRHLDQWVNRRRQIAAIYCRELQAVGDLVLPCVIPDRAHAFHLFVVRTAHRDNLIADSLIRAGNCSKILVVGAETLSKITDYTDRTTCILFGDGAGAVVLSKEQGQHGILSTLLYADGSCGKLLYMPGGG